jgi:hypothetical protein
MKVSDFDVDLIAYMALSEISKSAQDDSIAEDVTSKMNVHAKKLKENNSGFVMRL